jgi:hypothetical protein
VEAKGREQLADHLALNTSLSVDDAKAILAAAPLAKAEDVNPKQPANLAFRAAMASTPNPNVGADPDPAMAGVTEEQNNPHETSTRLLTNYSRVTGHKFKSPTAGAAA